MFPPDGYPLDGVHHISVSGRWIGSERLRGVDNIVINNQETPFYFKWLHNFPVTYEISLGMQGCTNWVREDDNKWVNVKDGTYQQWVLKRVADNTYTIAPKENSNLVWTDMGPRVPANQIELTTRDLRNANTRQHFHIN